MDRERIGLKARGCQLGHHKTARRLAGFQGLLWLLRRCVLLGLARNAPLLRLTAGWIAVLCVGAVFWLLSLWLSACVRLVKNRWMLSLRRGRPRALAELFACFSFGDARLAVRLAAFYRVRLFGRGALLFALPAGITAALIRPVFGGVSRNVLFWGAVWLLLLWLAAFFFFLAAREPLRTATALVTDPIGFAQRKSCLARLDKDCFQLARFSCSWLALPNGARFQAKALYADGIGL